MTLNELRVLLLKEIIENCLLAGGASIANSYDEEIYERLHLGRAPLKKTSDFVATGKCKFILVSSVSKYGSMVPTYYKMWVIFSVGIEVF